MAMVAPTQAVTTITPPASAHGERSSWDFAVPISPEMAPYDKRGYISNDIAGKTYSPRQPLSGQHNNTFPRPAQRRADTFDSMRSASGKFGYADASPAPPVRKPNGTGEADSMLVDMQRNSYKRRSLTSPQPVSEQDRDYWIHRDKLAQIERHELEEAGFLPRNSARSESRSSSRSRTRKPRDASSGREGARRPVEEAKTRVVSPIPAGDEPEDRRSSNIVTDWRSPEDIMKTERENQAAKKDVPRPGTSRIPLPKHTAAPIPTEAVEREAPLPRSRSGSQVLGTTPGPDGIAWKRRRGGSVGSQVLLDDASASGSSNDGELNTKKNATRNGTQAKAKTPGSRAPNPGKRTASKNHTGSQSKSRTSSGTAGARPRTASRPQTARPEGEAPWIATMYKPDPRLPPEEQMLPTHAKRIAQEQWEKEGKTGSVYDRDFKLLNDHDYSAKRRSTGSMSPVLADPVPEVPPQQEVQPVQPMQPEPEAKEEMQKVPSARQDWPLDSAEKVEQPSGTPQGAPTERHAGYKTTPNVARPVTSGNTTTVTATHSPKPQPQTIRMPDPGEKEDEKPKKSACCCVVM